MDKDSWILFLAFAVIIVGVFIYLMATGAVPVDWNAVFNIKTYPKN